MNKIERERLDLAIGYFARAFYEKLKNFPSQTQVYKYLAFVDFTSVKERGKPVFGLLYKAMQWGPVPDEVYNEFRNIKHTKQYPYFKVLKEDNKIKIAPLIDKELNMKFFSKKELELLNRYIEILIDKNNKTYQYSEASHEKIKAWKKAYEREPNSLINYFDEIENNEYLKNILEGYEFVKSIKED